MKMSGPEMEAEQGTRRSDIISGWQMAVTTLQQSVSAAIPDLQEREGVLRICNAALFRAFSQMQDSPGTERMDPNDVQEQLLSDARGFMSDLVAGRMEASGLPSRESGRPLFLTAQRLLDNVAEQRFVFSQQLTPANAVSRGWILARADAASTLSRYVRPPEGQEAVWNYVSAAIHRATMEIREQGVTFSDPAEIRTSILYRAEQIMYQARTGGRLSTTDIPAATDANRDSYLQSERVLRVARTGMPDLRSPFE